MNKLVFALALLLIVPALRAQQTETKDEQSKPETQAAPQNPTRSQGDQNSLPAAIRPGHPLDPADVNILTGKRDREIEATRRAAVPVMAGSYGEYGTYGDYYWMNGRLGAAWDIPMLPLARITSPFYFSRIFPRGFGRGGFRGRW